MKNAVGVVSYRGTRQAGRWYFRKQEWAVALSLIADNPDDSAQAIDEAASRFHVDTAEIDVEDDS